ncbi:MAG: VCBS repeat-containing protein [Pseudomonadota bacterium]
MKISSSDVAMAASRSAAQVQNISESLHAWVDDKKPDASAQSRNTSAHPAADNNSSKVHISDSARIASGIDIQSLDLAAAPVNSGKAQAINAASDAANNDPMLRLIKQILEYMLGQKITVFDASDLQAGPVAHEGQDTSPPARQAAPRAGWGLEYDKTTSYTETEQSSFQAKGVIQTADGKEINFNLSVNLQRSYSEQNKVSIRAGDAKAVDPLVVNFSGNSVSLTSQKFAFDLEADGKKENISFVQGGGFLALDKNGDGKINDGTELFGPASGNGFSDLNALDSDGNGWIDENDAAFQDLKVWTKDASGADKLSSLKDAGVGALYLGNVGTAFQFKDAQNNTQGQLRSSGVWLTEDGKAGALQQIDLSV